MGQPFVTPGGLQHLFEMRSATANAQSTAPSQLDAAAEHTCAAAGSTEAERNDTHHCPKVITFDVPGAATQPFAVTEPFAINPAGVVIGDYFDTSQTFRSFLRKPDGTFITFAPPGSGLFSNAWSINPAGEIAGAYADSSSVAHGFLRTTDGKFITFDAPGAGTISNPNNPVGTNCVNINAAGETAGEYFDNANVSHGFVRFRDSTFETFDAPGAGTGPYQGTFTSTIDGLNSAGNVAGWYVDDANAYHGYVRYHDGRIVTFDVPGSGTGASQGTSSAGINDGGEILGSYVDDNNVSHGFVRAPDGRIDTFDIPGAGAGPHQGTQPANVNTRGDITGDYIDANGTYHGFVRDRDGRVETFDAPGSGTANGPGSFQGTLPECNNPMDAITGWFVDPNNNVHGFLRTP